jgi:peptide-methionine (S)-S-oxide reductase
MLNKYQNILNKNNINKSITTEVKMNETFFYAEDYHQQYLEKNPQGYCGIQGLGISFDIN